MELLSLQTRYSIPIIWFLLVLFHIIADFNLQGLLAKWKQKKEWYLECSRSGIQEPEKSKYKYDWLICLIAHAFMWSVITYLPLLPAICYTPSKAEVTAMYVAIIITNTIVHAYIDHLKCNEFRLNLLGDQLLHILQITGSLVVYVGYIWKWVPLKEIYETTRFYVQC